LHQRRRWLRSSCKDDSTPPTGLTESLRQESKAGGHLGVPHRPRILDPDNCILQAIVHLNQVVLGNLLVHVLRVPARYATLETSKNCGSYWCDLLSEAVLGCIPVDRADVCHTGSRNGEPWCPEVDLVGHPRVLPCCRALREQQHSELLDMLGDFRSLIPWRFRHISARACIARVSLVPTFRFLR
jgi:hypothetical protein